MCEGVPSAAKVANSDAHMCEKWKTTASYNTDQTRWPSRWVCWKCVFFLNCIAVYYILFVVGWSNYYNMEQDRFLMCWYKCFLRPTIVNVKHRWHKFSIVMYIPVIWK